MDKNGGQFLVLRDMFTDFFWFCRGEKKKSYFKILALQLQNYVKCWREPSLYLVHFFLSQKLLSRKEELSFCHKSQFYNT